MVRSTSRGTSHLLMPDGDWKEYTPGSAYRCEVYLRREGGEFVAATALPNITGRGKSESEALENIRGTAAQAIREYKSSGQQIPWQPRETQSDESLRVIMVIV